MEDQTTSFIPLINLDLSDSADILTFLKEFKVPLPTLAITDVSTGRLYHASGASLRSVHDPFNGEHITIDPDIQSYIGHIDRSDALFHSVFVDDEGNLLVPETSRTLPCELRHQLRSNWTSAMLDLTFQPESR
jgi:hypothetical protein